MHACSELGSLHSNALKSFTVGLESSVMDVKAMYPSHKVVAIVGHGELLSRCYNGVRASVVQACEL
jgi:hypothetical protein